MRPRLAGAPAAVALVWLATGGCGPDADASAADARAALEAGDDATCQATFRRALDRHPEHLELLLIAGEFYLREPVEEHYKPRLGLHYANRAGRAAGGGERADVFALRVRALRAMEQHDDARALLDQARTSHPDDPQLAALAAD